MAVHGVVGVAHDPEGATSGWAVCIGNTVLVKTVSPTRRAALVNWIVTELKMSVFDTWPDDHIDTLFERQKGSAEIRQVEIRIK